MAAADYQTAGFDRYGASRHVVTVDHEDCHVLLSVDAASGANGGKALLTPGQARAVGAWLIAHARMAEAHLGGDDGV